jgi:uncharacterized membrane protein (DUF4010 family)
VTRGVDKQPMTDAPGVLGIVVAALGGAAVGIERQRSGHASGERARFGGVRTFALLGGVAGLAGWFATLHLAALAVVLAAGAIALVIAGYAAASRTEIDATTEVAALVVIGAGLAAGLGSAAVASGVIAVSVLLLVEKSHLHALVGRIDDEELRAAARFGVMAVVILPLLPEGPFGPWSGIRPRALWLLVLFFTGLSFSGYLARRIFGATQGYPLTGMLAGLISSTNATFTFARLSRREQWLSRPLAVGTIAACTVLFPRVIAATFVLDRAVARALLPYLAVPFAVGAVALILWWRAGAEVAQPSEMPSNPLQIRPALEMAALFQIVLFVVDGARRAFGESGLLISGAVLGLTDVDALTISMARSGAAGIAPDIAAKAIAIGILANCLLKLGLAVLYGTPPYKRLTSAALSTMAVANAIALGVLR